MVNRRMCLCCDDRPDPGNFTRAQGRPIRVAKLSMASVARGIEFGETRGFMKALVDAETNQILGCAILGLEGGEVMSVLQVAMMGKLPLHRYSRRHLCPSHTGGVFE